MQLEINMLFLCSTVKLHERPEPAIDFECVHAAVTSISPALIYLYIYFCSSYNKSTTCSWNIFNVSPHQELPFLVIICPWPIFPKIHLHCPRLWEESKLTVCFCPLSQSLSLSLYQRHRGRAHCHREYRERESEGGRERKSFWWEKQTEKLL